MCSMWCRIHPRLLIGMPAPAIREMLHLLCACTHVHVCVCWLSESYALSLSRHYTVYPLSADALVLLMSLSTSRAGVYFKTCALRHHLHCICKLRGGRM